ncbi:uncharacterized protein [Asterias amurensis]|uniref:uncharacterized protein n=1 Tax=Asterias amurensis TaxID=7602 RepID=UPI003AB6CF4E
MSAEKERRYQELYKNRFVNPIDQGVGRRTGWVLNKEVRKDSEGFEVFDDYWSDSGEESIEDLSLHANKENKEKRYKLSSPIKHMLPFTPSSRGGSTDAEPLSDIPPKKVQSNSFAIAEPHSDSIVAESGQTRGNNASESQQLTQPETSEEVAVSKGGVVDDVATATPTREEGGIQESDITGSIIKGGTSFLAPHSALQEFKTKTRLQFDDDVEDPPRRRSTRSKPAREKGLDNLSEEGSTSEDTIKASQSSEGSQELKTATETSSASAGEEQPQKKSFSLIQESASLQELTSKTIKGVSPATERQTSLLVDKEESLVSDVGSTHQTLEKERVITAEASRAASQPSAIRNDSITQEQRKSVGITKETAKSTRRRRKPNKMHVEEDGDLSGEEGMFISLQKSLVNRHDGTKEAVSDLITSVLSDQSFQDADDEGVIDIVQNDRSYKSTRTRKSRGTSKAKGGSLAQDEPVSKTRKRKGRPRQSDKQDMSKAELIDGAVEEVLPVPEPEPVQSNQGGMPRASSEDSDINVTKSTASSRSSRTRKSKKTTGEATSGSGEGSQESQQSGTVVANKSQNRSRSRPTKKTKQNSTVAADEMSSTGTDEERGQRTRRKPRGRKVAVVVGDEVAVDVGGEVAVDVGGEDIGMVDGDSGGDAVDSISSGKTKRQRNRSDKTKKGSESSLVYVKEVESSTVFNSSGANHTIEVNNDEALREVIPQEQIPNHTSFRKSLGNKRASVHFGSVYVVSSDTDGVEATPGSIPSTSLAAPDDDDSLPRKRFKGTPGANRSQNHSIAAIDATQPNEWSRKRSIENGSEVVAATKKPGEPTRGRKGRRGKRKLYSGDLSTTVLIEPSQRLSQSSTQSTADVYDIDSSIPPEAEGSFKVPQGSLSSGRGKGRGRSRGKGRGRGKATRLDSTKDAASETQVKPASDAVMDFLSKYEYEKSGESAESSDDPSESPLESSDGANREATHSAITPKTLSTTVYPEPTPRSILKDPKKQTNNRQKKNLQLQFFEVPKAKAIIVQPDHDENGQRRTRRNRVRPLEFWRNERAVYQRRMSGGFALAGVDSPAVSSPEHRPQRAERGKKKLPHTPADLSMHGTPPPGGKVAEHPAMTVVNPDTQEEVVVDTVKTAKMYKFVGPSGKEATNEDPITLCKCISQKAFSSGILTIRPLSEKGLQLVRNDTMVFYITRGKVAVTIHHTTSIMQNGDMFFVPQGNLYNVKNLRRDEAKLVFFQHKG